MVDGSFVSPLPYSSFKLSRVPEQLFSHVTQTLCHTWMHIHARRHTHLVDPLAVNYYDLRGHWYNHFSMEDKLRMVRFSAGLETWTEQATGRKVKLYSNILSWKCYLFCLKDREGNSKFTSWKVFQTIWEMFNLLDHMVSTFKPFLSRVFFNLSAKCGWWWYEKQLDKLDKSSVLQSCLA